MQSSEMSPLRELEDVVVGGEGVGLQWVPNYTSPETNVKPRDVSSSRTNIPPIL